MKGSPYFNINNSIRIEGLSIRGTYHKIKLQKKDSIKGFPLSFRRGAGVRFCRQMFLQFAGT
jgi:hypothetical protein